MVISTYVYPGLYIYIASLFPYCSARCKTDIYPANHIRTVRFKLMLFLDICNNRCYYSHRSLWVYRSSISLYQSLLLLCAMSVCWFLISASIVATTADICPSFCDFMLYLHVCINRRCNLETQAATHITLCFWVDPLYSFLHYSFLQLISPCVSEWTPVFFMYVSIAVAVCAHAVFMSLYWLFISVLIVVAAQVFPLYVVSWSLYASLLQLTMTPHVSCARCLNSVATRAEGNCAIGVIIWDQRLVRHCQQAHYRPFPRLTMA